MSVTVNTKNQVTNSGFVYDNGGNLTSDGTHSYTWDGENRLASTGGVTYTYDGDGKRVQKSNGTIYWYDLSGNVLEETDASGNRLSAYIYFGGKRVGRYDPSGAHYAYLSDLIGSSVVVTDSLGHIQNSSDYYPFGGERHVTNNLPDHYKFTGMERDGESGLDHTLYRQFTSTYGRWLSPDPECFGCTNPQKLNRYAYVLNNPVTLTDPLGLDSGSCSDIWYWESHAECGGPPPCVAFGSEGCISLPPITMPIPPFYGGGGLPQLHCSFTGADIQKPGWGTATLGKRKTYRYYMPVIFNFSASGGSGGPYEWTDTQDVKLGGIASFSNGTVVDWSKIPSFTESLNNIADDPTGPNAKFFDAPGQAQKNVYGSSVVSANLSWSFTLHVSVMDSSGNKIDCPTVSWSASLTWKTRNHRPVVNGGVTVSTEPTP